MILSYPIILSSLFKEQTANSSFKIRMNTIGELLYGLLKLIYKAIFLLELGIKLQDEILLTAMRMELKKRSNLFK